jgi:hypothetical protein
MAGTTAQGVLMDFEDHPDPVGIVGQLLGVSTLS